MTKITLKDTGKCTKAGCHEGGMIVGTGRKDYKFPSVADLVRNSIKSSKLKEQIAEEGGKTDDIATKSVDELLGDSTVDIRELLGIKPRTIIPSTDSELAEALLAGADGLQEHMVNRQFDGLIEQRFGDIEDNVIWARSNMPEKFHKAIGSLHKQLTTLKDRYSQALPMVVGQLVEQNPQVPLPRLIEHAIQLLDQQLMQILFILNVYSDCFKQSRNVRRADELASVSFFYEQAFALLAELLDTDTLKVGDVFLSRFSSMGLSTIPGAKGPIGAHALQVPYDMQDVLMLQLPLLAHEFRHNLFHDIEGMEEELTNAVTTAITDAVEAGDIELVNDSIDLGDSQVAASSLLAKMAADCIGEIDADIAGGVLLSGPSYLYSMIMSFPAMMIRGSKVSEADKLLRTSSAYNLEQQPDGSQALTFLPHPPDYIRVHIVAASLDEIGFPEEAEQLRKLADYAVGEPNPEFITWDHAEGAVDMTISIPVEDIIAAAPVIAKTLIRKELETLGGKSTGDILNWTPRREEKVQLLAKQLVVGKSDIPADAGTVYATYIGSAAILAYWLLLRKGINGTEAATQVNKHAMSMMKKLQAKTQEAS